MIRAVEKVGLFREEVFGGAWHSDFTEATTPDRVEQCWDQDRAEPFESANAGPSMLYRARTVGVSSKDIADAIQRVHQTTKGTLRYQNASQRAASSLAARHGVSTRENRVRDEYDEAADRLKTLASRRWRGAFQTAPAPETTTAATISHRRVACVSNLASRSACKTYVERQLGSTALGKAEVMFMTDAIDAANSLRENDWLVIDSLARAASNSAEFVRLLDEWTEKGLCVHVLDLPGEQFVTEHQRAMLRTIMITAAAWQAERQRAITTRSLKTKRRKHRLGQSIGGKLPWDKQLKADRIVPHPTRSKLVTLMRRWRDAGCSLRTIQKRVTQRGESISLDALRRLTQSDRSSK